MFLLLNSSLVCTLQRQDDNYCISSTESTNFDIFISLLLSLSLKLVKYQKYCHDGQKNDGFHAKFIFI